MQTPVLKGIYHTHITYQVKYYNINLLTMSKGETKTRQQIVQKQFQQKK